MARAWHTHRLTSLDKGHGGRLMARLEWDAFPVLGRIDLKAVTAVDVLVTVQGEGDAVIQRLSTFSFTDARVKRNKAKALSDKGKELATREGASVSAVIFETVAC